MTATKVQMNLVRLIAQFQDDDACRDYLEGLRWPKGVTCSRCQSQSVSRLGKRDQLDCNSCRYRFSVTSGSIFHDSHLPLSKWFLATYMMCESKKGISALQLKRSLDVAYKTAWYLCHRIRAAMKEARPEPLSGTVEVDETWIGGTMHGKGRGFTGNKAIVAGAVERSGNIRLQMVGGRDRATLHKFIKANVAPETEAIYTDDWAPYQGIGDADTKHETVNHSIEEWVNGKVHTNTVEGVWSLFKRSLVGSYHKVSVKHLDAYLDELEWRFNNRANPYLFRDTLLKLLTANNLEYKVLTS